MKKIIRKSMCILVSLFFSLGLIACTSAAEKERLEKEASAKQSAKEAYQSLNLAYEDCDDLMNKVYSAWYFAIYEGDEKWIGTSDLADSTGLDKTLVDNAFNEIVGDGKYMNTGNDEIDDYFDKLASNAGIKNTQYFSDPSYTVAIIIKVYKDNGKLDDINAALESAKEDIKVVKENYPDASYLEDLQSYYSEVLSYYEFASSPSGSFSQLGDTVDGYTSNIKKYKNNLSIDFEE